MARNKTVAILLVKPRQIPTQYKYFSSETPHNETTEGKTRVNGP
jgi:hypothetical protein